MKVGRLIPGIGGILAAWLFMPHALVDRGPYLQVVGHYSQPGAAPVTIGSGPETDLRLTESGVAPLHGWLLRSPSLKYVHDSTSQGSQLTHAGFFPGERWNSFERLQSGDTVSVLDQGRLLRTDVVTLLDARTVELISAKGESRKTLLPDGDGHGVPLPDVDGNVRSWLIRCEGKVGFSAVSTCGHTFRELSLLGRIGFSFRTPVRPPEGAPLPEWLRKGQIRKGSAVNNAFAQINNGDPRFIPQVNDAIDPAPDAGYVLYRSGRKKALPRIARTGSFDRSVIIHRGNKDIPVGETLLSPDDTLSLGETYFRVEQAANGQITLRTAEKDDRFHFFYSLSAGRLNFATRVQPLPRSPAPPLTIEAVGGTGSATVLPPPETAFNAATSSSSWQLPVAARFAAAGAAQPATGLRIPISTVRTDGAGTALHASFLAAPSRQRPPDLFPAASLDDGKETQFAGHVIELHGRTPQYEQRFPPLAMCVALLVLGYVAAGAIVYASDDPRNNPVFRRLLRVFVYIALACISFLIMVGVLMMSRMAALDLLIGKPDYYHRQLVYSYATVLLVTAIVAGLYARREDNSLAIPSWMGFPLSLSVIVFGGGLLFLWQLVDFLAFYETTPTRIPWTSPIAAQLIASAILLLLFMVTGWILLRFEDSSTKHFVCLPLAGVLSSALFLMHKGMTALGGIAAGVFILWLIVYAVSCAPKALRLSDTRPETERVSYGRYWWNRGRESWRLTRQRWGVLQARQRLLIGIGLAVLGSGAVIGSGREGVGVKPAEFAVWFLAPGLCAMLAIDFQRKDAEKDSNEQSNEFSPAWPRWLARSLTPMMPSLRRVKGWFVRWWRECMIGLCDLAMGVLLVLYNTLLSPLLIVAAFAGPIALLSFASLAARPPAEDADPDHWLERLRSPIRLYVPVLLTILTIEVLIDFFYVIEGDLGPLLVLVPSIAFLTVIWALSPDYSELSEPPPPLNEATEKSAEESPARETQTRPRQLGMRTAVAALFLATCLWGGVVAFEFVKSPFAAEMGGRSAARATKRFLTTSAPWFTKEGSWSTEALWLANGYRTHEHMLANLHSDLVFVALVQSFGAGYAVLTLVVFGFLIVVSLASLGVKMSRWSGAHRNATVRLQSRRTTLLLYFAGIYLAIELIVHVGSSLNAMWQTGVTLPWISSGGSASIGFGGLCAIALTLAITGLTSAETGAQETEP
jgi:cell division protein FtsW (lipid II flippase)